LKYALEAFEKLYETKGRAMFVEHYCSYDKELFGSPQRYEQLCNFLNWPPVPELIEDYALQHNMTETVEKNENILKKEKFDWVFYQIEELSQADVGRNLLIEKVKVGFKEKFEKSVDLRRFRGIWTVKIGNESRELILHNQRDIENQEWKIPSDQYQKQTKSKKYLVAAEFGGLVGRNLKLFKICCLGGFFIFAWVFLLMIFGVF
jgi:hypothetical protein